MVETRSQLACRWSCERLFEYYEKVYLWTFTLEKAMPSWWIGPTWHRLLADVTNYYGKFHGVRVFEWHKTHGLHVHVLLNVRVSVHVVRRLAKKYGFGRIHVTVADANAPRYLTKYLGKDYGRIPHAGRSWQSIGGRGVRCRHIVHDSTRSRWVKRRMKYLQDRHAIPQFTALKMACYEWDTDRNALTIAS